MAEEPSKDLQKATAKPPAKEQQQLPTAGYTFIPQTWEQLYNYAKQLASTDFVPKDLQNNPGAVLAVWQVGKEIGLPPMAALQSIAVINGRPTVWGDGALAIVRAHPLCESFWELPPHDVMEKGYGECRILRRGDKEPTVRRFTQAMAEAAGLWGGKGNSAEARARSVWATYPHRMLAMRARSWAMRDAIPEAFRGVGIREEVEDEPRDVTPAREEFTATPTPQPLTPDLEAPPDASTERTGRPETPDDNSGEHATLSEHSDQAADSGDPQPAKPTEKAKPATLVERIEWIKDEARTLEDFHEKAFPVVNLKTLSQGEQAAVFRAFNDRKQELYAAASKT